jgi:hypothetical protein
MNEADCAREYEEWTRSKCIGAIKVGKDRYFWMVYRSAAWVSGKPDADADGFASTLDAALEAGRKAADAVPGTLSDGAQRVIRSYYRKIHARRPPPSPETSARPIGMLGSLWEWVDDTDGQSPGRWCEYPITKITAKRVFICRRRGEVNQYSLDRAELENGGDAWYRNGGGSIHFHSAARKAGIDAGKRHLDSPFPLLGLPRSATRAEVLTAFRNLAKAAHPDAGGNAAAFRELVAEKDRALSGRSSRLLS